MGTAFDRRLGRRVPVDPRAIGWRVTPPGQRPKRTMGLFKQSHQEGRLLELSVSGAQVRAPAAKDLGATSKVWIEIDGVVGQVRIRRVLQEPGVKPGTGDCIYGLELGSEDSELTRHVHKLLDDELGTHAYQWHGTTWA